MRKLFTLTLALLASFSLWANQTDLISGVTLPDIPESALDMATQEFKTPDANGWIVMQPNADIRNTSVTWFTAMAWNTTSVTISDVSGFTAPFVTLNSTSVTTVQQTGRTKAIRFTGAEAASFLVASGGSRTIYVSLFSYNGTAQTLVETKSTGTNSATELYFSSLNSSTDYIAYMYESTNSNGWVAEIALKKLVCQAPANPLVLTSDANENVYVGDVINLSTTGGNGAGIGVAGTADETLGGYAGLTWTATAGEHTFVATQDMYNGFCAQEAELVFNVLEKNPVTAVTIDGPTAGIIGQELTYTATAANATAFAWYVDDALQEGETDAEFVYTGVKGNHSIYVTATNAYTATPVASEPIALTVSSLYGELITATLTSGSAATVTGIVGGTADVSLSSNMKMDNDKYFGINLASGAFQEGDTVIITMTKAGSNYPCLFADKNRTNLLYLATETSSALEYKIILPAKATGLTSVYLARHDDDYKWNPVLSSMSVIRPKEVKSVTETLSNVKIDGVAISSANLTTLLANESLDIAESYLNAPEVKFYKTIRTTYEDDSYTDKLDSIVVTAATEAEKWQAQATINAIEYTITMAKQASFTVTYKLGSRTLGSELVIANGNPADYEDYQTIDNNGLSTFVGWYSKSDLSGDAVTMASAIIAKDTTFYAKFNIKYASSINIEKWILDNGAGKGSSTKTDALIAEMNSHNYSTNIEWSNTSKEEMELDSLDDDKTSRNEPYLGLKVKKSGKLINFRLKEGDYVKVKFGQVNTTPKVAINGGDYTAMTITDNVYTYNATGEDLVSIYIDVAQKAVVYKQIMINEDIQNVTLPDTPTAIDNTADEIKAVKFVENGQLFIRRGEKVYTITGEEVK